LGDLVGQLGHLSRAQWTHVEDRFAHTLQQRPRTFENGLFSANKEGERCCLGARHTTRDRRIQHGDAALAQTPGHISHDHGRYRAHVHMDQSRQRTVDNPIRPERDRLDIAPGGDHGEHHLARLRDCGGRGEKAKPKAAGVRARALAARISDERVTGGEQMPHQLAAHVAKADKSESHGFHLNWSGIPNEPAGHRRHRTNSHASPRRCAPAGESSGRCRANRPG
jgi:hypothetical protein